VPKQRTEPRPRPQLPTDRLAYSPSETGGLLGMSEASVRRAIRAGEIRAVRVGRRLLVPASEPARILKGD
jgi:excisionase family DNA binding protein